MPALLLIITTPSPPRPAGRNVPFAGPLHFFIRHSQLHVSASCTGPLDIIITRCGSSLVLICCSLCSAQGESPRSTNLALPFFFHFCVFALIDLRADVTLERCVDFFFGHHHRFTRVFFEIRSRTTCAGSDFCAKFLHCPRSTNRLTAFSKSSSGESSSLFSYSFHLINSSQVL